MEKQANHQVKLPLEPQDIKKLRKQVIPVLVFPFLVVGVFYLIFTFVFKNVGDGFMADGIAFYVMIGFGIFFLGIIAYIAWAFFYDIRKGIKYRITGSVTDRQVDINTSHRTTSNSNSSTRTTRHYYIFIDGTKYKVNFDTYSNVKTGDRVQLDRAPKSALTLRLEILEPAITENYEEEVRQKQNFIETKIDPVPLTNLDLKHLKNQLLKFMGKRLLWNSPLLFIIFSLIATEMAALLLFVFPVVIIVAYQFYRVVRAVVRYFKNKSEGYKQGITAIVEDKLTVTSNRTATKYKVEASGYKLTVPKEAYQKLAKNDKIIIFKPFYGKEPLSLVTMDQDEYYL